MTQPNCYRVTVETTNPVEDTFVLDRVPGTTYGERYRKCEGGCVYVLAENLQDAARQVPNALSIERVGIALSEST